MQLTRRRSQLSIAGLAFMLVGMGLVIFEMQTAFLLGRIGPTGRLVVIFCGTGFSVWGLKEVITGIYPSLAKTGYSFELPREGLVYLVMMCALFIGSLIGRNNLLLMVFACLAGPFVMNGWITFTMLRGLQVRRQLPQRVMAGDLFSVSLTLENRKSWLTVWLMTVHDSITRGDSWLKPEILFVRVPSGSQRQGHYQLKLPDRGRYQFGPLHVTSRFPLGLVQRGTRLDLIDQISVYPRVGYLKSEWRKLLARSTELVHDVPTVRGPNNDEMSRVREYRLGDEPRMIHWKTTARMNELMVCEYEESRDRHLLLIIDAWSPPAPLANQLEDFERGLRFAITVCMDQLRNNRESSLVVKFAARPSEIWQGDLGEMHVDRLLETFAALEPTSAVDLSELFTGLDESMTRHRRLVVLSLRPEAVRAALQQRGVAGVLDSQVYGMTATDLEPVFQEAE